MEANQPDLVQRTLFAQDSVKQIHQSDFVDLESDTKINIIYRECMLVLFYASNIESKNLTSIWSVAAKNTVGPVFAACNLMVEKKVAEGFASLNMQNGALHWAALKTVPYIIVYQNGWPIAFYNGERSVQALVDFSLTLACRADYHEPINLYAGLTVDDNNNIGISGVTQYGVSTDPFRKDSLKYLGNENIRGYNPQGQTQTVGSPEAKTEASQEQQAELASGGAVDQGSAPPPTAVGGENFSDFGGSRPDEKEPISQGTNPKLLPPDTFEENNQQADQPSSQSAQQTNETENEDEQNPVATPSNQ